MRRLEEAEHRRKKREERELAGPTPFQIFVREESARLMKEVCGKEEYEWWGGLWERACVVKRNGGEEYVW